jgi:signal peptide peptidase SppA
LKYQHLYAAFTREPWFISPAMHGTISSILMERIEGIKPDLDTIKARIEAVKYGSSATGNTRGDAFDGVMVISLYGVIFSRAQSMTNLSGATNPQAFANLVNQGARDPQVKHIILDIDSPGGTVNGLDVAASAIRKAKKAKPVYAVIAGQACSAAYYLASQATEIIVGPGSAVGCIGAIMTHYDHSQMLSQEGITPTVLRSTDAKSLGSAVEPMEGRAKQQAMSMLMRYHQQFIDVVALGRGIPAEKVQGWADDLDLIWMGEEAVTLGLADRVGTLDDLLSDLGALSPIQNPDAGTNALVLDDGEDNPEYQAPSTPLAGDTKGDAMIEAITAKINQGEVLTDEEKTTLLTHLGLQEAAATVTPEVQEAAVVLPEAVQAQLAELANLKAAEETRLSAHWESVALGLNLPTEQGPHLRAFATQQPEAWSALSESITALKAQAEKATEVLGATASTTTLSPLEAYNAKVQEYAATGISQQKAIETVALKHPELVRALNQTEEE